MIKTLAAIAAAASLAACVSPTPYRAADTDGTRFGYTSSKLSDQLYRVRFVGTGRTPSRWVDAFLLYRAAEIARDAGVPAFKILEGTVDTSVLTGEDIFGGVDLQVELQVTSAAPPSPVQGDTLVGSPGWSTGMRRTAGAMPVFRMPPPSPPKYQPPIYIYTPSYVAPALPDRTLLIELRSDLKAMDDKTYVTADVLQSLAPRIKRSAPSSAPGQPAAPAKSL